MKRRVVLVGSAAALAGCLTAREQHEDGHLGSGDEELTAESIDAPPPTETPMPAPEPEPTPSDADGDGSVDPTERVRFIEHEMHQETVFGRRENTVTGVAENIGETEIISLHIEVIFLDEHGEFVQRFGHRCGNIPPGGTCDFSVSYGGSDARAFSVEGYEVGIYGILG